MLQIYCCHARQEKNHFAAPDPDSIRNSGSQHVQTVQQVRAPASGVTHLPPRRRGKTGYSSSFLDSVDPDGRGSDVQAGLTLSFPWQNSAARAADRRATLSRDQAAESIANLAQLVEVDVRGAWIEVARLREQVAATEATRRLQEETLRAETEKFRVGKSTAFLVAQAQRGLLQAAIAAETAVAGCLKALVELYRLEGSLLDRRGISVSER